MSENKSKGRPFHKESNSHALRNQFLDISSQQKSRNNTVDDFSAMSFQDAKDLIEKDENERLQFMNSNVSFSNGIEQMEAPSFLSITNYFQQGSSFPVPYVGNDSTMMSAFNDTSNQSQKRISYSGQNISDRRKMSNIGSSTTEQSPPTQGPSETDKSILSRNDSLAKFFLDSKSDGMKRMDMMEYVLDYCKRRASMRLSDASDISTSHSDSKNITPERHDSGIGIGSDKSNNKAEAKSEKLLQGERPFATFEPKPSKSLSILKNVKIPATSITCISENEASLIISDGASLKENELSDVSDVGSIDGFEKFKKNLLTRRKNNEDRYRNKIKHHERFEKQRLKDDEEHSVPELNKQTDTISRPCDSQNDSGKGTGVSEHKHIESKKARSEKVEVGERPLVESDSKSSAGTREGARKHVSKSSNIKDSSIRVSNGATMREKKIHDVSDTGNIRGLEQYSKNSLDSRKNNEDRYRENVKQHDEFEKKKKSLNIEEPNSAISTIVPNSHSHQIYPSTQTCSCPHQCTQQPVPVQVPNGMIPGIGHPIVIHIHLPCAPTGTVVHPVPTITSHQL